MLSCGLLFFVAIELLTVKYIDESTLFDSVSAIIENRKFRAQAQANQESIIMFWEIGKYISSVLLGGERAGYGKQIVVSLARPYTHFNY